MRFTRGFGDGILAPNLRAAAANPGLNPAVAPARPSLAPPDTLLIARRAPANPRDAKLSKLATNWCVRFDAEMRPVNLCRRYPRVANRLALCWEDSALTARIFQDLLVDRRGSRRGFPPEVQRELLALREVWAVATL
jgi:hypothetical protein